MEVNEVLFFEKMTFDLLKMSSRVGSSREMRCDSLWKQRIP